MYLDEVCNNAFVGLDACIAVFLADIAFAISLQQGIGKHAGTS